MVDWYTLKFLQGLQASFLGLQYMEFYFPCDERLQQINRKIFQKLCFKWLSLCFWRPVHVGNESIFSKSQELCTVFMLCCVLLSFGSSVLYPCPPGLLTATGTIIQLSQNTEVTLKDMVNVLRESTIIHSTTMTKHSTTKLCAYHMGYPLFESLSKIFRISNNQRLCDLNSVQI